MKEEEAKTKWCPHMFYGDSCNRFPVKQEGYTDDRVIKSTKCIASDCMMWIQTDNEGSPTNAEYDESSNAGYFPSGHCGLARKS